jgi:ABC-type Fe3+ transport system permease subunit
MEILKNILLVIYIIIAVLLILVTTFQAKDNTESIEDTYENPRAIKQFDKVKGRTKSGKVQRNTIILGVLFTVLTIVVTILIAI